jgi:ferredoxin
VKEIKTVQIVFFSGTGGTARIAAGLEAAFARRRIEVRKNGTASDTGAGTKRRPARAFVPCLRNERAAVRGRVDRSRARGKRNARRRFLGVRRGRNVPNTACRTGVIRKLKKKGYDVYYENMFVMPGNVFFSYGDVLSAMLLRAVPKKTERAVSDLVSGKRRRTKPLLIDPLLSCAGRQEKRYCGIFGRKLKANGNCTGCAWCARQCPRGNIVMRDGKPVFGSQFVICLRCVYGCPVKAIVPGPGGIILLREGYDLNAVERSMQETTEFPPVSRVAKGIAYLGVRRYLNDTDTQTAG